MKVTKKDLRTLIEAYLFEQDNEGLEEFTHTVVSGDNLSSIAARFNTTSADIVSATDGLDDANRIRVGQEVIIPSMGYYTVVSGDNLSSIAERFGSSANSIQSVNNINNPNSIRVNQKLTIPLNVEEEGVDDGRHDISHYSNIVSAELPESLRVSEGLQPTNDRPQGTPALVAYRDTRQIWTIGYGHATTSNRAPIPTAGMRIDADEAEAILEDDITHFRENIAVQSDIYRDSADGDREARLTQNEFDALVSASFNAGVSGIGNHRDGTNGNRTIGRQILDGVHTNPGTDEYRNFENLFRNARTGGDQALINRRAREWNMFANGLY
jgi:LysM repeat protein/GH24 family phage-related lysozyme (muramidase)